VSDTTRPNSDDVELDQLSIQAQPRGGTSDGYGNRSIMRGRYK